MIRIEALRNKNEWLAIAMWNNSGGSVYSFTNKADLFKAIHFAKKIMKIVRNYSGNIFDIGCLVSMNPKHVMLCDMTDEKSKNVGRKILWEESEIISTTANLLSTLNFCFQVLDMAKDDRADGDNG